MNIKRRRYSALLGCLSLALPLAALAQTTQLRIGSLVPKNSPYHQQLLELGETWRAAQGGNARFAVFTDGSQGGEAELARRMRIGQLQGALMSVVGLREIEPSISALQNLPLLWLTTSIPKKSGNLPQKSGTYTRKIRTFFLLREASRLLFKFYVRSYIRTFISFRMYYRIPTPPRKLFCIGAEESWVRMGLPNLRSNITKFAEQYDQNLRSSMTKICEAV